MVCAEEAQGDIATLLGVTPVRVEPPTWSDHVYSCRYTYTDGAFVLSVKELSSEAETTAYYDGLGARLGRVTDVDGFGQGAFITANGSVVVRKDAKVLLVDDSALPPAFGRPPVRPADTSMLVAKAILGCWTGA